MMNNRKDFGTLVSILRDDLGWTQAQLAEYSGIEESVISNIERGAKRHFEPELLFALANALQLSSTERYEFLISASGLENEQLVRQPSKQTPTNVFEESETILAPILDLLAQARLPSFVLDGFGDMVAANMVFLALMSVRPGGSPVSGDLPGRYNLLRLQFDPEISHAIIPDFAEWEQYSLTTLRAFRAITFRNRIHPYHRFLMREFRNPRKYPGVDRVWRKSFSVESDKNADFDHVKYTHSNFGQVAYVSVRSTFRTRYGELHAVYYVPTDNSTHQLFQNLLQQANPSIHRMAAWPEKKFPAE